MQLILPDGVLVLARGRLDLVSGDRPRPPDFAMYLDERWAADPTVTWPHELIDWPDFGLPADEEGVFAKTLDVYRRARENELVEVACYGGVGRTGTVLSCMSILAGTPGPEAVAWVREHYHARAVETADQGEMVLRFAAREQTRGA